MNNFPHSAKYKEGNEYNQIGYTPRHSTRSPSSRNHTNKHTNTPQDFMVCLRCQEQMPSKVNQQCNSRGLGDCDNNMLEYTKALNYINSCHMIINQMMEQSKDFIRMPDLPNFVDVFNSLTSVHVLGGDSPHLQQRSTHESRFKTQPLEDRNKNNSNKNNNRSNPQMYHARQSAREKPLRQTTKGKYIELLPDTKHDSYKNPDNMSPGTTESEESDFELQWQKTGRVVMPNKFKSTIRASHEKVIYEEDSPDDDSSKTFKKKEAQVSHKDDSKGASTSDRPRQIQNSPVSKSKPNLPVPCGTSTSTDSSRKIKQRSSSTVAPREKPKIASNKKGQTQEVVGNFSDTAIAASSSVGQIKKFGTKSLSTPIDLRNTELSQQELDKYAKELLGSESPVSRSPRSKSPVSNSFSPPTITGAKPKSDQVKPDQDKNKKCMYMKTNVPTPSFRSRIPDSKRKPFSDKQQTPNNSLNITPPSKEQQINRQQQQQQKKYKKDYDAQQSIEQDTMKKQNSCRKSSGYGVVQNQCKGSCYTFAPKTSQSVGETNYARNTQDKKVLEEEEDDDANKSPCSTNDNEEDNGSSPDQLNLLCDNTEILNMHCQPRSHSGSKLASLPKVQFAVTTKPNDFFTVNRKSNSERMRCTKRELEYDMNGESDEIKTDSDIEEDHFDKDDEVSLSRKSSKTGGPSVKMTHVLSHLGLLPNAQMPPETEQLMSEAKSTRANDERNRPFREPRKNNEDPNERIVKLEEGRISDAYQRESNHSQLHRTISEESSDIKSDDDMYNVGGHPNNVPFNYCLDNGRYQS